MTQQATRKYLRIAIYALLLTSAGATFVFDERLWSAARLGDIPMWAPLVAPALFTVFVAVYTVDRWFLVRRRNSSLPRAVLQVAFATIFLTLLLPPQAAYYREAVRQHENGDFLPALLHHGQAEVRAAACELVGRRVQLEHRSTLEALAINDDSVRVRTTCKEALDRLATSRAPEDGELSPERP